MMQEFGNSFFFSFVRIYIKRSFLSLSPQATTAAMQEIPSYPATSRILSSSAVPNHTLDRFLKTLPFVDAVACLDFGPGDLPGTKFPRPDAIHFRSVSLPRGWNPRRGEEEEDDAGGPHARRSHRPADHLPPTSLTYVSKHETNIDDDPWVDDRHDADIQHGGAYDLWRQVGYGIVCTGSFKEAKYLKECCRVKTVVYVDDGYLRARIEEMAKKLSVACCVDTLDNLDTQEKDWRNIPKCQYRCHTLVLLIEEFKKLYFENIEETEVHLNFF